jgi:DNA repair photolyase
VTNPPNRFEHISLERDADWNPEDDPAPKTQFLRDLSQSVISYNTSPDLFFDASINPYRGCEHGCSYCYARNTHEYLGFSAGLDFESKIMVKENAPELLRRELSSPKWKPQTLAMSGVTDCYQPVERRLQITRKCLAVLAEFRNPVSIITKNYLVTRDIDLLQELAAHRAVMVHLSINSLDSDLARHLEPRAASPKLRLAAVEALAKAGVPVGVLVAPVIPALNDHEIPSVLAAAKAAGAGWAYTEVLRLPLKVAPIFEHWLERNVPGKKDKVLNRIRAIRGGKLNDPRFGSRMRGEGIFADQISQMFHIARRKVGLPEDGPELSAADFRRPTGPQLALGL